MTLEDEVICFLPEGLFSPPRPVHILVCNALGIGHYTPIANLVQMLLKFYPERVRITWVAPIRRWEAPQCPQVAPHPHLNQRRVLLDGNDVHPILMTAMVTRGAQLVAVVDEVLEESFYHRQWPAVDCTVHDFFAIFAYNWSCKSFTPRRFLFNTSHTASFGLHCLEDWWPKMNARVETIEVPGLPRPLHLQYAWQLLDANRSEPVFQKVDLEKISATADGILTNDIDELWPETLAYLEQRTSWMLKKRAPRFALGPWMPDCQASGHQKSETLRWLDEQPDASVFYVSIGTLYPLPLESFASLAMGLKNSGVKFLWVHKARERDTTSYGEVVNEAYLREVRDRGRVVPWVDQRAVLSHPALRVFVSHCGWNSLRESFLSNPVPMIAVPLGSEQAMNAILVSDVLGLGPVALRKDEEATQKWYDSNQGIGKGENSLSPKTKATEQEEDEIEIPDAMVGPAAKKHSGGGDLSPKNFMAFDIKMKITWRHFSEEEWVKELRELNEDNAPCYLNSKQHGKVTQAKVQRALNGTGTAWHPIAKWLDLVASPMLRPWYY